MNFEKTASLIKKHEGLRLHPYSDATGAQYHSTQGKLTIGYGRNIEQRGITIAEASVLLMNDINYFDQKLALNIPFYGKLDEVRKGMLIDLAYNIGINGVLEFKNTLEAINAKEWKNASKELLDSKWSHQVQLERRNDLSGMLITGEWPHDI